MGTIKLISKLIKICKILSGIDIYFIILLIFASTLAEAFSIGLIIPIFTNQSSILEVLGKYGIHAGSGYLVGFIVLVFMLKSWFVWHVMDKQNSYSFRMQYIASIKIFSKMARENYQIVAGKGKDYYSTLFNIDLIHFRDTMLLVILLLTELAVVGGLLVVAIYFAPLYTIVGSLLLIGAAFIFRFIFARTSSNYGRRRIQADRDKNTWVRGFLGSLEESRVMNVTNFFEKKFDVVAQESSYVGAKQITVNQSPRFLFESLVVIMIGAIVIISLLDNDSSSKNEMQSSLLSLITLAAIAFRVLPSLNRISGALQGISFGAPAIETIGHELSFANNLMCDCKNKDESNLSRIKSVEVQDIHLSIANNPILRGGTAYFNVGGINALIGGSGAGKSSLIKSILGLYKIDRGSILINNCDRELCCYIKSGRVALVPQQSFIVDGTVLDNILVGRVFSENQLEELSELLEWVNSLPNGILTRIGETGLQISGGQAQRLNIARALYELPDFVIMDESTSALDVETQESIMKYLDLYSSKHLVVMITHREEVLKKCKSVHRIHDGFLQKCV
ncbi:ABC transporter ATP-binding protein [Polynucleobacter paneuropaeus]|nr:ABC transporter ATP-binding protein [Polynucleobacter paneuropaeus]